jgi:site-specific DNA recombinase
VKDFRSHLFRGLDRWAVVRAVGELLVTPGGPEGVGVDPGRSVPDFSGRSRRSTPRLAEPIDAFVLRVIANKLSEPEAAALLIDRGCENMAELQLQAEALRKRLKAAEDDYKQGFINGRVLKETTDQINHDLGDIEAKVLDANNAHIFDGVPLGTEDVDAALRTLPLQRQQAIIRALVRVTILPGDRGIRKFDPSTVQIVPV